MRGVAGAAEPGAREPELRKSERHADRRREEADAPAELQREPAGDERPDEGAEVDAHVEDREAGVPPTAALRIQPGNEGRDVGLQEPDAEDDHDESGEEERRRSRDHEHQVADRHERAACHDGALCADQPVRDPATRERRHEDGRGVQAIDGRGRPVVEPVAATRDGIDQEQHQQRTHAIERESLPHLREEERGEPARVAEEAAARVTHRAASPRRAPPRRPCRASCTARAGCRARRGCTSARP